MIYYLAHARHLYTMRVHLAHFGGQLRDVVVPLDYERFSAADKLSAATYIFSDIDRLDLGTTQAVARRYHALSRAADRSVLLNHPTRSMKRYQLLRTLHELAINDFNVYRLTEARRPARFPVFLRPELHLMSEKTVPLLDDDDALDDAVEQLHRRGNWLDDVLVVEFLDTVDAAGIYRKYSAFRIGDRIIPRHINFSRGWFVKSPDAAVDSAERVEEEWRYVQENPHAETLMKVFRLAGIEYGRVDYGLCQGRVQVWEINTNPNMGPLHQAPDPHSPRWPVQSLFARRYEEAMLALVASR